MSKFSEYAAIEKSNTINVNGVTMTVKEFKEKYATKRTKKRSRKVETAITVLPSDIKELLKGAKVLNSLSAYYRNGYKQWGNICKEIMSYRGISAPFTRFVISTKEFNKLVNEINDVAKRNSKAVYQLILQLSWRLEDVNTNSKELYNGINETRILESPIAKHECISGEGRRLGLNILMYRSFFAMKDIDKTVKKLQEIADDSLK